MDTFTGEGFGGLVLSFSLFTGFGCLVFGRQVRGGSKGAATDGQLKERCRQRAVRHLQQEVVDMLDWE